MPEAEDIRQIQEENNKNGNNLNNLQETDLNSLMCNSNEIEQNITSIVNDSSVDITQGSPENSFAVSLLKTIRKKYLTPEIYTHLNRTVRMVKGTRVVRTFNFKCSIADATMQVPEIGEILRENSTQFTLKKILEDFIRIAYLPKNNACDLNFKNIRINKNSFVAYAYCTDLECNTYVFNGDNNGDIFVLRSQEEITHTIDRKNQYQCRGVQRYLQKAELSFESALSFQRKQVNKQSDELRAIGKSQMVKSLSYIRNIKAESAAEHDRDADPFIDTYLMFKSNYNHYIQFLSTKLEVFLWSKKQISILRQNNDFLLKKINYTLHVDATGRVVQNMPFDTKKKYFYILLLGILRKKI